jgi:hypothetical protein
VIIFQDAYPNAIQRWTKISSETWFNFVIFYDFFFWFNLFFLKVPKAKKGAADPSSSKMAMMSDVIKIKKKIVKVAFRKQSHKSIKKIPLLKGF